ncbi:hypothetical protein ACP70R_001154 [Stipagrostis hirtigluma subsp. patula]
MAYVSEGLGKSQDWAQVMAYQRKNGSFFNSPSTTAAVAIHSCNHRALDCLDSLVRKFGSSVPMVYPLNVYSQLCMVDTLERMGISHSFTSWLHKDEEITQDMATCAIAFRLLRMHGYDISAAKTLLELYKASQVQIFEEESILESIGSWSAEVEHALKFPFYTTLDRLEHKRNIESFKTVERFHTLKSAYRACRANKEIASLAAHEFSSSQSLYQEELQHIESWVKESRLDELKFARMMPSHPFFCAAATMFPSQLSEARIAWAKESVLVTVIDDFFDFAGSREETTNLVALMEKWDTHSEIGFCSEYVEIIFRAIYNTTNEIGGKAMAVQNRSVVHHLAEKAGRGESHDGRGGVEVERQRTVHGRVHAGVIGVIFAGPIALTQIYLVGPELPEEVIRCPEYNELYRHMSICCRLLNDLQTYEKERGEGNLNSVTLHALLYGTTIEAAKEQIRMVIEVSRKELLRLLATDPCAVPRACKEVFWDVCKSVHMVYFDQDTYLTPKELMGVVNAVLRDPLQVRA